MRQKKAKLPLDRTLRYLIQALRLDGGVLMAVEFTHRGKHWRVDTVEEAIALRRRLEEVDVDTRGAPWEEEVLEGNKWTPDRFLDLVQGMGTQQRDFVRVLLYASGHISADDVAEKLGLRSLMALAGIQSGLSKQLRTMGLEPSDVYQVWIDWSKQERVRYLKLNPSFRFAADNAGWPPEKYEKKKAKREEKKTGKEGKQISD